MSQPWFLTALIFSATLVGCGTGEVTSLSQHPQLQAPDTSTVEAALSQSSQYLVDRVDKDGRFAYLVQMDPTVKVSGSEYNVLRHAGTIYALCSYYQQYPSPELLAAIKRAGRYLQENCLKPFPNPDAGIDTQSSDNSETAWAIWSHPEVSSSVDGMEVKLGGSGLGLVALMSIEEIEPGFTPPAKLMGIGRGIATMQSSDGGFYSKYLFETQDYDPDFVSLYYPGEACLGLVMLHQQHPDPLWIKTASAGLKFLVESRRGKTSVPADHWALIATEKLIAVAKPQADFKDDLIAHAEQICEAIMKSQVYDLETPEYVGGYNQQGRTTPTATRLEGLLASLFFIPKSHSIYPRIENSVNDGMSFLLSSHVNKGEFAGAFPGKIPSSMDRSPEATEVRIDYVQHAMSAMLQYLRYES
jgi:hypothetical protein